jgi:uncharacterized protein YcaQ
MRTVSVTELRRYLVAHQGYAARSRRASASQVAAEIGRLGAVQLDSISTVDRAHRITLATRVGGFDEGAVSRLLGKGRIFEYWAHEACLLPIEDYPLFKRRMLTLKDHHWWGRERTPEGRAVEREVLERLGSEGALPVRAFEGKGDDGTWGWGWKPAKRALEHLFAAGEVAIAGRQGFQRVYDLPERVIPQEALDAPTPTEDEFRRSYALRAVQGRGALTEAGIAEHCRFDGGAKAVRPHVDALVEQGALERVELDDGGPSVAVPAGAVLDGAPVAPVLLCPFDNLMWDRPFLRRVFGFDHLIEVYKREHERVYGYYVLPLLIGDRFAGRADLKADRASGVLQIRRFTPEPKIRRKLDDPLERAATRLATSLGLPAVERAA